MFQKKWFLPGINLFVLLMFLLSSSCASKPNLKPGRSALFERASAAASSSKSVDLNESQEKKKSDAGPDLKEGKCVFGCPPSGKEKKTDEKTALFEGHRESLQVPGSSADIVSPDYLLGSEDVIEVTVWKNENLSRVVAIRPDGKISLPLIGDVEAAGLTTSQIRESIREKLKEYKESPEVSVIVREINSLQIYITGEVLHPGKIMLRSDTSVLQAIIIAGGFTQYASPNSIVLLRRVGGVETRKVIRYKDIVSGRRPSDDVILQRGDTIVVP